MRRIVSGLDDDQPEDIDDIMLTEIPADQKRDSDRHYARVMTRCPSMDEQESRVYCGFPRSLRAL
jgi:hypothetical protein